MAFKRHQINRRVIDDLKSRSTIGMYFYMAVTIGVLSVDGFYKRHFAFSVAFLAAMTFIAIFRISHYYLFDKIEKTSPRLNFIAFFASVFATSLTWGLGFAYFMVQPEELSSKIIMLASTVGLDSGGVVAFIPSWGTSALYTVIMLMPAAIALSYFGVYPALVLLIILFIAYMMMIAFRGNREYWNALENEYLLKQKTEEIQRISRVDVLTGLYNRRYFDEIFNIQWKAAVRNSTPMTIVIADIDHFKRINDTYGHLAGDAYLKKIAELLAGIFKRDTDFIARYGGEEFVFLLDGLDRDAVIALAETVRSETGKMTLFHYDHKIQTTISLGISSCVPQPNDQKDRLFEKADKAMYQAKNSGRNQVVFYYDDNKG
ncbi:MAG: diguanylate cyclase [Desulfobacteraceae bacterium]|nr:MAG: diguanylate cyclase [Desulfobacteraceae bacterium]